MTQAFGDLRNKYAGTVQAAQAGLLLAKNSVEAGDPVVAKEALVWVANQAGDDGLKALAKLRLAGVLLDQKAHDEAFQQLSGDVPPEFHALFADRKGDVLVAQGKRSEAIEEYLKAHKAFEVGTEYRRLVEIKLAALGASPAGVAIAAVAASAEATK
jgi:predicted negative regulator of RcsB-dependent stress response